MYGIKYLGNKEKETWVALGSKDYLESNFDFNKRLFKLDKLPENIDHLIYNEEYKCYPLIGTKSQCEDYLNRVGGSFNKLIKVTEKKPVISKDLRLNRFGNEIKFKLNKTFSIKD